MYGQTQTSSGSVVQPLWNNVFYYKHNHYFSTIGEILLSPLWRLQYRARSCRVQRTCRGQDQGDCQPWLWWPSVPKVLARIDTWSHSQVGGHRLGVTHILTLAALVWVATQTLRTTVLELPQVVKNLSFRSWSAGSGLFAWSQSSDLKIRSRSSV